MAGILGTMANLFRLPLLGMTIMMAAIGVMSADTAASSRVIVATALVATGVHIAMYVLNDIVDVEIDRSAPRRVRSPLVTGAVSGRAASMIVGVAIVGSFALDRLLLGHGLWRWWTLAGAFALITIYDLYGKKLRFPPLADFIQGLGCGMVVLYGSIAAGGANFVSWTLAGYLTVYFAMANGIHGGLRDAENDHSRGARTTAILLGAKVEAGVVTLPLALRIYALVLQSALVVIAAVALAESAGGARHPAITILLSVSLMLLSSALLIRAYRYAPSFYHLLLAGAAHITVAVLPALVVAASGHSLLWGSAMIGLSLGPLFVSPRLRSAALWLLGFEPAAKTLGPYGLAESNE